MTIVARSSVTAPSYSHYTVNSSFYPCKDKSREKMPFEPKVDVDEDCLICCEPLNHDLNFYPCPCEFQVTLWSFRKKIG